MSTGTYLVCQNVIRKKRPKGLIQHDNYNLIIWHTTALMNELCMYVSDGLF